jgi:putative hydrolase of the HAD superfamily
MEAVIFDLDDTLYDERQFVAGGFKAVAQWLSERTGESMDSLLASIWKYFRRDGRGVVFDHVLSEYGLDIPVGDLVEVYRNHQPDLSLYPDAEKLLSYLKEGGWKLGLITDGLARVQRSKIKALGIESVFDVIVVTDEWGRECWKPSPYPYELAVSTMGIGFSAAVYVGDNPHKDFVTAKKLGMKTVRIIRDGGEYRDIRLAPEYEADREVNNLLEIVDILNRA